MLDAILVEMQDGHAAFRPELGLACVTGIEIENAVDGLGIFFVGMAKNDRSRVFAPDSGFDFF